MMPSAEEQLRFLNNVQRVLTEGSFVATYKYALLMALADICVEAGSDADCSFALEVDRIAEKFIEYYWRHAVPYPSFSPSRDAVLYQNTNPAKSASIIGLVQELRKKSDGNLVAARLNKGVWKSYRSRVAYVITAMPLWKLQTLSGKEVCFLYPNQWFGGMKGLINLNEGVMFNFRRFHQLIQSLVRDAWVHKIRELKANQNILGQISDLEEFLFGSERQDLSDLVPILFPIQRGTCFYCERSIGGRGEVDHFIPWSLYSLDLGHNFVLAHASCNVSKSDYLPAPPHLERWLTRNQEHKTYLAECFEKRSLVYDLQTSTNVARWAYQQAEQAAAYVWLQSKKLQPLTPEWHVFFPSVQ